MKTYEPLISVVTVNFNNRDGLLRTVVSVNAQRDRHLIQHIVVDGNSSDGSAELLVNDCPTVDKCIIESDSGIFDAMNKGARAAQGEMIYFLNSGDVFASDLSVHSVSSIIDSVSGDLLGVRGHVKLFGDGIDLGFASSEPWPCHQSIFLRTTIMKEYMFNSKLKIFGDLDLWRRIKNDQDLRFYDVDSVFAEMELDGVGSNPVYFIQRGKDKFKLVSNGSDFLFFLLGIAWEAAGYFVFSVFGSQLYYSRFLGIKNLVRKNIRRFFRSFRA